MINRNIFCKSGPRAAANQLRVAAAYDRRDRQTDGRTVTRPLHRRLPPTTRLQASDKNLSGVNVLRSHLQYTDRADVNSISVLYGLPKSIRSRAAKEIRYRGIYFYSNISGKGHKPLGWPALMGQVPFWQPS